MSIFNFSFLITEYCEVCNFRVITVALIQLLEKEVHLQFRLTTVTIILCRGIQAYRRLAEVFFEVWDNNRSVGVWRDLKLAP